jgi:lysyl-tRNA synthetase class II
VTEHISQDRLKKIDSLLERGQRPYPARTPGEPSAIAEITKDVDGQMEKEFYVAGRLGQVRDFGKLRFSHLSDRSARSRSASSATAARSSGPGASSSRQRHRVGIRGELGLTKKGEPRSGPRT